MVALKATSTTEIRRVESAVEELRAAGHLEPTLVAPVADIHDGVAVLDARQVDKQPDWTFDATFSGSTPVELRDRRGG